jgi:pullulanase
MDWQRALFNEDVIEFTKACIRIRKKYKALRLKEAREIEQFVRMSVSEGGIVFYDVTFEDLETGTHVIRAIINPSYDDKNYVFEPGWTVILDDDGNAHEEKVSEVYVPRLSLIICVR